MPDPKSENQTLKELRKRNKELLAANEKLRQDRDTLLHKINAVKKKMADAELQSEQLAEIKANNKILREKNDKLKSMQSNQIEQLTLQLKHKDDMIAMAHTEAERARAEVKSYANSTSWRLTAPIRALINLIRR